MDNKTNKMLIDATHPEETRVVVLRSGRVEEFDYESAARKLLRGNIYLAKVTRVEPSLQAAFVEYGGNRHGFLAFNEIHPDYYQIPVSDRQALIDDEAAAEAEADAEADARAERKFSGGGAGGNGGGRRREGGRDGGRDGGRNGGRNGNRHGASRTDAAPAGSGPQPGSLETVGLDDQVAGDTAPPDGSTLDHAHADHHADTATTPHETHDTAPPVGAHTSTEAGAQDRPDATEQQQTTLAEATGHADERVSETYTEHETEHAGRVRDSRHADSDAHAESAHDDGVPRDEDRAIGADHIEEVPDVTDVPETIGAGADTGTEDDGIEDVQERPRRQRRRTYKIQEVIKRRQVILVQVVKEERGNKGAALTTYLSLAGRYTVLMPNTGRGGGISRKIVNPGDRKRLKAIAQELDVPEGMGLIIRTAGAARTSQEIKRDYEYLLRLWESVREMTLQSTAPSLVYEEGNLIKRSIRDLYTKEIDEVVVAGDQAYADAHDFMRMLMPSHTKNVIRYTQPEALFTRYPIEKQLNAMFSPYVTLKSGGYLVINQTEALVSIDVNSGKSTREYSIEETALATNLEASDEIARQLKLRDLAGLIVIDFIDMEEKRNNRKVEHRLTDALRFDRARIQVGRISHFGLMEMSRQRMRTGVLEGSTSQCPHCQGTGMIRSTESVALAVLRGLEDHLVKDPRSSVNVMTTAVVALYILNNKRAFIIDIERRYGIVVAVQASDRMQGANFAIERSAAPVVAPRAADRAAVSMDWGFDGEESHEHESHNGHDHGTGHDQRGGHTHTHESAVELVDTEADGEEAGDGEARSEEGDGNRTGRRRRRRRGRDRGDRQPQGQHGQNGQRAEHDTASGGHADQSVNDDGRGPDDSDEAVAGNGDTAAAAPGTSERSATGDDADRGARRGRRRGRRGGRRGREQRDENGVVIATDGEGDQADAEAGSDEASLDTSSDGYSTAAQMANAEHEPADHQAAGSTQAEGGHEHVKPVAAEAAHAEPAAAEPAHEDAGPTEAPAVAAAPQTRRREPRRERIVEAVQAAGEVTQDVQAGAVAVAERPHNGAHEDGKADADPVAHAVPPAAAAAAPPTVPKMATAKSEPVPTTQLPEAPEDPSRPRRRGWWQRRSLGE